MRQRGVSRTSTNIFSPCYRDVEMSPFFGERIFRNDKRPKPRNFRNLAAYLSRPESIGAIENRIAPRSRKISSKNMFFLTGLFLWSPILARRFMPSAAQAILFPVKKTKKQKQTNKQSKTNKRTQNKTK